MTPPHHRDEYGAIRFAVSNRRVLLAVAVVLAVAACGWAYLQTGAPGWLAAAAIAGAIVFGVGRLLLELLVLIADMLLPR